MALHAFWAFIYTLQHHTAGCTARTESTHSVVLYGGNCVQSWLYSIHVPGIAWIYN